MRQHSCRKTSTKPNLKSIGLARLSAAVDQRSLCQIDRSATADITDPFLCFLPVLPTPSPDGARLHNVRRFCLWARALVLRILLLLCRRETTSLRDMGSHRPPPSLVLHASVSVDTWTVRHLMREREVYVFSEISVMMSEVPWS